VESANSHCVLGWLFDYFEVFYAAHSYYP